MTSMRDRLGFVADSSTSNPFCRAQARCPPAPSTSRQFCLAPFPSRAVRRDTVSPDFAAASGCAPADADQEATSVHRPCQGGGNPGPGGPAPSLAAFEDGVAVAMIPAQDPHQPTLRPLPCPLPVSHQVSMHSRRGNDRTGCVSAGKVPGPAAKVILIFRWTTIQQQHVDSPNDCHRPGQTVVWHSPPWPLSVVTEGIQPHRAQPAPTCPPVSAPVLYHSDRAVFLFFSK